MHRISIYGSGKDPLYTFMLSDGAWEIIQEAQKMFSLSLAETESLQLMLLRWYIERKEEGRDVVTYKDGNFRQPKFTLDNAGSGYCDDVNYVPHSLRYSPGCVDIFTSAIKYFDGSIVNVLSMRFMLLRWFMQSRREQRTILLRRPWWQLWSPKYREALFPI